jgi:15-cis-phytoene desaturase
MSRGLALAVPSTRLWRRLFYVRAIHRARYVARGGSLAPVPRNGLVYCSYSSRKTGRHTEHASSKRTISTWLSVGGYRKLVAVAAGIVPLFSIYIHDFSKKNQKEARTRLEKVVIAGAGLAGLSAAKYLSDLGYSVLVLEKRAVAGGKVSSWQDADGHWVESGLHVFFGAYRNLLRLLRETGLDDNLAWMPHALTFSGRDGALSPVVFPGQLPAPWHGLTAIARSRGVLTQPDKLRTGVGLLWPILANQEYIDRQDDLTYERWHLQHGLSRRSLRDFFDTMGLALNFAPSSQVSAKVLLTVLSHFGKETDASRVAFLKGPPQTRLFGPFLDFLRRRGVEVRFGAKVSQVAFGERSGLVQRFELADGTHEMADFYISAMPVHNLWKTLPESLRRRGAFAGLRHLDGVPVITVQLYFDCPVTGVHNLIFSSRSHISVYAELGRICPDFREQLGDCSMVELVAAPAAKWLRLSDDEVIAHVMREFSERHPRARSARLLKSTVVRIPQSVYRAGPGLDRFRPDQQTSIPNFFLCGDFTRQEYLASMEGAVLSGKRVTAKIAAATKPRSLMREVAVGV